MNTENNYIQINKASWNTKTDLHLKSEFYDQEGFLSGNTSLQDIEMKLLGDVTGKSILHLQCHFGQDTISLGRLGAEVTGVDFSERAIESAREIAGQMGSDATFICCDIYDLPNHLDGEFDIVFTSYGTIGWLPDLGKWAQVISTFLKPGGQLIFVEFHPVVWIFDDNFGEIKYNYFNKGAIVEELSGSYADRNAAINQQYVMWNHSMSDVITQLINHGLDIIAMEEFDYSPYNCFNKTIEIAPRKYRIEHLGDKIPMVYAVVAGKKGGGRSDDGD